MQETQEWFDAAIIGDAGKIISLLEQSAISDVNIKQNGETALQIAVNFGNESAVQQLLRCHADPNIGHDSDGITPLMTAADGGFLGIVRLLMAANADLNMKDKGGSMALNYAKKALRQDVIEELVNAGAKSSPQRIVIVMGAGFTRAFLPQAPLLMDNYGIEDGLTNKYQHLSYARDILRNELKRGRQHGEGYVDLERLMTRLAGGMPYDASHAATNQLNSLLDDVKLLFLKKLEKAREDFHDDAKTAMKALATDCLNKQATIITFNYDEFFDEMLFDAAKKEASPEHRWNPDRGYGFFCKSSGQLVGSTPGRFEYRQTAVRMLKLHGSVNWRVMFGAQEPFQIDTIYHHSKWYHDINPNNPNDEQLEYFQSLPKQFEAQPLIVPPILTKSALNVQPILRYLWEQAYDALIGADKVIFVGYSLPVTDIAASFIFPEAMSDVTDIEVVGWVDCNASLEDQIAKQKELMNSYRRVFPGLRDDQFRFDGARAWAKSFITPVSEPTETTTSV